MSVCNGWVRQHLDLKPPSPSLGTSHCLCTSISVPRHVTLLVHLHLSASACHIACAPPSQRLSMSHCLCTSISAPPHVILHVHLHLSSSARHIACAPPSQLLRKSYCLCTSISAPPHVTLPVHLHLSASARHIVYAPPSQRLGTSHCLCTSISAPRSARHIAYARVFPRDTWVFCGVTQLRNKQVFSMGIVFFMNYECSLPTEFCSLIRLSVTRVTVREVKRLCVEKVVCCCCFILHCLGTFCFAFLSFEVFCCYCCCSC